MRNAAKLFLAAVAILAVLCSGAWAGEIRLSQANDDQKKNWQNDNTYIVDQVMKISDRITVNGSVTLKLIGGFKLTAENGINVSGDNSLTISCDLNGTGELIAENSGMDAAIGGNNGEPGGTITIEGGKVTANSSAGAGIGGGYKGVGGEITILGGIVEASAQGGAGIGGGAQGAGGEITITDGTVTVVDRARQGLGAGLGGGNGGDGGVIKILGGTVKVTAWGGAGIGGGCSGGGGTITINGGTVETASEYGAGIGGGLSGAGGDLMILSGTVTANSSAGAGIGGGRDASVHGTLSSDPNGSGWIAASIVSADISNFNGVIFYEKINSGNGKVHGSATVSGDVVISADKTLEIPTGNTLTVADGAKLTIQAGAKLINEDGGKLDSRNGSIDKQGGDIANDGSIYLRDGTTVQEIKALGIPRTVKGRIWVGSKKYFNDGTEDVSPTPDYTPGKHTGAIDRNDSDELWDARVGGDMMIHIGVDYDQFASAVSLDGVPLVIDTTVSNDFGAREGSTIVTIWEHTLRKHITTDGEHKAEVGFKDGSAIHKFNARGTGEAGETKHSSGGACTAGAAAFVAIAALAVIKRRKR